MSREERRKRALAKLTGPSEDDIESALVWNCCMIQHLFNEKVGKDYPVSRYLEQVEVINKMNEKKPTPDKKQVMTLRR